MSIQLDPQFVASIREKLPKGALLAIAVVLALPGAALGGWYLYCEKFSGEHLLTSRIEEEEPLEVALDPAMNPISVSVGRELESHSIGTSKRDYELSLIGGDDSVTHWSNRFTLRPKETSTGTSLTVGVQSVQLDPRTSIGLGTFTVESAGTYALLLNDSTRLGARGLDPDVVVALRRNARSFSILLGVLGFALFAVGMGAGALAMAPVPTDD